jgi:hypothetical protein
MRYWRIRIVRADYRLRQYAARPPLSAIRGGNCGALALARVTTRAYSSLSAYALRAYGLRARLGPL